MAEEMEFPMLSEEAKRKIEADVNAFMDLHIVNTPSYNLIGDPQTLADFIDDLPDLEEDELFFMSLFVRKKYMPEREPFEGEAISIPSSIQLWRGGVKKEHILKTVYSLEQRLPYFTDKEDMRFPPESFCLYIHPNPRNNHKASALMASSIVSKLANNQKLGNIQSEAKTFLQKTKSRSVFSHFDYDDVEESFIHYSDTSKDFDIEEVPEEAGVVIHNCSLMASPYKTRSGIHLLIRNDEAKRLVKAGVLDKLWYKKLSEIEECDEHGDFMMPMVGCYQGGEHIVRKI